MASSIFTARTSEGRRAPVASCDANDWLTATSSTRRRASSTVSKSVLMRRNIADCNKSGKAIYCSLHVDASAKLLQSAYMSGNFIKEWRDFRGLSQEQASERAGYSQSFFQQLESGFRRYNRDNLERIAEALGCTPSDLLGRNPIGPRDYGQQIPIVGKAAADAEGHMIYEDGYSNGAHPILEPFEDGSIATEVEGDSMEPRFRARERIIWGYMRKDPTPFVGEDVLCRLTDGRVLIKTLARNKTTGNWNLISYNPRHPIIEDVKLEWVRPFEGLRH